MFRAVPLPETCRGSFFSQNKFVKLVRLLVLLKRKEFYKDSIVVVKL